MVIRVPTLDLSSDSDDEAGGCPASDAAASPAGLGSLTSEKPASRPPPSGSQSSLQPSEDCQMASLPARLGEALLPFQREGVEFVVRKHGRACIGDDMGLGKTIQAIAVASRYQAEWPCLVFMPASMRWVWAEELEKWLEEWIRPGDVKVVRNCQDTDDLDRAKFVLCTYDICARSKVVQEGLHAVRFGVCIVDESHYCKNRDAQRTKAVSGLARKAARCVLLSGTPALNRPVELFSQMTMLQPGLFGSFTAFTKQHCDAKRGRFGWEYRGATNLDELHTKLSQVMIRRLKADVLHDLPAKRRQRVPVELESSDKEIQAHIKQLRDNLKKLERSGEMQRFEIGVLWGMVAKETGEAKMGVAGDYVVDLVRGGCKLLVFAHYISVLDHLEQKLAQHKIGYIRIDGGRGTHDAMIHTYAAPALLR